MVLDYGRRYDERWLDELDAWFCKNQNDPKSSVVILAGFSLGPIRKLDGGLQPPTGSQAVEHKVWNSWAFLIHTNVLPFNASYYDLHEQFPVPHRRLTLWEEADLALEERRLRLAS
jgi:hypothetical protein